MTEYDFSPAAYDRFMESQSRVGRWVDNANEHAREFVNPFVPSHSNPAEKSDFYASPSSHRRSKSSSVHSSAARSYEVPETRDRDYGHRSGGSHHHRSGYSSPNTRSSSSSSGTSSSATYTARPHNSRSYTMHNQYPSHGAHAPPPQPVRSRTMPHGHHYELDPRGKEEIILPPMKPGQTYVIIPPHGKKVNVVSTDGSHVVHRVPSSSSPYHSSPTREQPLIKRLFGMGSTSGSHSSRMTGVETGGKPRRSHGRRPSY